MSLARITPTLASISSPGDVGIAPVEFDSSDPEAIAALAAEIQMRRYFPRI